MSDLTPSKASENHAQKPLGFLKKLCQPKKTTLHRPEYFRKQGKIWLVGSVVVLLVWFVLWLIKVPSALHEDKKEAASNVLDVGNLPVKIDSMNESKSLVSPINFDEIIYDLRSYPPEFKGKSYFSKYKDKWSVHVMDVAEHEVIVNYLANREDREKFTYFRYTNENGQVRYVLTYDVVNSLQEALGATRTVDFELPNSVRIFPEQMQRYFDMIDNYERASEAADMAKGVTEVNLQETSQELPPEPTTPKPATPKADEEKRETETPKPTEQAQPQNQERGLATAPTAVPVENPPSQPSRPRNEPPRTDSRSETPVTQATPQRQSERQQPAPAPTPTEQIQSIQSEETYE